MKNCIVVHLVEKFFCKLLLFTNTLTQPMVSVGAAVAAVTKVPGKASNSITSPTHVALENEDTLSLIFEKKSVLFVIET